MSPTSTLQHSTAWRFLIAQSHSQYAKKKLVEKHRTNTCQQVNCHLCGQLLWEQAKAVLKVFLNP